MAVANQGIDDVIQRLKEVTHRYIMVDGREVPRIKLDLLRADVIDTSQLRRISDIDEYLEGAGFYEKPEAKIVAEYLERQLGMTVDPQRLNRTLARYIPIQA